MKCECMNDIAVVYTNPLRADLCNAMKKPYTKEGCESIVNIFLASSGERVIN